MSKDEMNSEIKGNDNYINQIGVENNYNIIEKSFIINKSINGLKLDDKAFELLKNTIEDETNISRILLVKDFSGNHIQCGNGRFSVSTENNGEREMAYWESALEDLINYGLIVDAGNKGEVFKITKKGYDYYDKINNKKETYESAESIKHRQAIKNFINYNRF